MTALSKPTEGRPPCGGAARRLSALFPRHGGDGLAGQDVPMEDVQYLAGHTNPQTTQI